MTTPKTDPASAPTPASDFDACFEQVVEIAGKLVPGLERPGRHRLVHTSRLGRTELAARAAGGASDDGRPVSHVITVRTQLAPLPLGLRDDQLGAVNGLASLSSLMRDPETGELELASRLTCYQGDEAIWPFCAPMLAVAFGTQAKQFFQSLVAADRAPHTDWDELKRLAEAEPSLWIGDELFEAAEALTEAKLWSSATRESLTVEFPWDPGAVSAMLRFVDPDVGHKRTSLLRLTTADHHPVLGPGLLARLDLPLMLDDEGTSRLAHWLNLAELEHATGVPFFGAWCDRPGIGRVSFVCFLMDALKVEGAIWPLCVWMQRRAEWARQEVEELAEHVRSELEDMSDAS